VNRWFLATYRPLVGTAGGRLAVHEHRLPPFIDGSCRREPDFESQFPSITATCRAGQFAPRLQAGDYIIYLTVKGKYPGDRQAGWRLTAVLRTLERCPSHAAAAAWYRAKGLALPSNCIVQGNAPQSYDRTNRAPPPKVAQRAKNDPDGAIRMWDAGYRSRVSKWPAFLICNALYLELREPVGIDEGDMIRAFGRVLGTLTPPELPAAACMALLATAGLTLRPMA
jgi:hypothetical protein